ncbi:MAG TPA: nucleotide exchange factor GrpE [Candidatus Nitrosopolaris sp.]|nr:nucleotide exchange factor GrpE [Candidatus Nitrosopolaris sp.]
MSSKKPTIQDLQQQVAELTEALRRERADAMNVRRRTEEDKAKLGDFYKAMILRELLPALDNLDRALKHYKRAWDLDDEKHEWIKGLRKVREQFEDCFAKLGVQRIKTVGEPFDPKLHEAISVEDAGGQVEIVCEELQPGYRIGDEIIRHALVKVKMEKK